MTIGEKIKKVRSLRGLTQKELGLLIGLSNIRVQQYESGYRIPQGKIMKDICDALEVSECFFCKSSYGNRRRYYPVII